MGVSIIINFIQESYQIPTRSLKMVAAYIVSKSMPCHIGYSPFPTYSRTKDLRPPEACGHVVLDQGYREEGSVRKGKNGVDSL